MERRLRPIAPKPMPPSMGATASSAAWRARKRGREDHLLSPAAVSSKREREATPSSSYPYYTPPPPGFPAAAGAGYMPLPPEALLAGCEERLRGLSLVPAGFPALAAAGASPWPPALPPPSSEATTRRRVVPAPPVERDLISKLGKGKPQAPKVIKPRAARPLCTTICIDSSNIAAAAAAVGGGGGVASASASTKTAREVEAELELPGALPAVVSGRGNGRVHLVNDAYKVMVGQPVCPWLDALLPGAGAGAGASRRINGRVVLDVRRFGPAPRLANGGAADADAFPCTARITWEQGGGSAIASLTVPCAVEHLTGGRSGDYRYIWRFDSSRASIIYCIV